MRQINRVFDKKIPLPFKVKRPVLALGSQAKNTLCFAQGKFAYLSRVHPDLNNPQDFLSFEQDVRRFIKKNPKIIAYDLHPEYQSSKYALSLATRYSLFTTQHHHSHIASCMADNGLKNQKVIGVAFDGTGLGTDNTLWGAEFLLCNYKSFIRRAHLKEIPLLGGEKAILEPVRLGLAWLYPLYKEGSFNFIKGISRKKARVLKQMYLSGFNSPLASSMGRLFDAAASLILEKGEANFEAELAMKLEKLAMNHELSTMDYNFKLCKEKDQYILDPLPIFKEIIKDLRAKEPKEKIAHRFHSAVAEMVKRVCLILRKENRINKVVLSGGVFQNKLLLRLTLDLLYKEGFRVFTHKNLSCNDSGISLGQAVIANFSRLSHLDYPSRDPALK